MSFFHHRRPFRIVIFLITAVFLATGNGCSNDPVVYKELIGTWITDEEQYENRYITISNELVIFGTGGGAPNLFFIETARKKDKNGIREYDFYCLNTEETDFSFIFEVEDFNDQTVFRLKNPNQVVWKKIPETEKDVLVFP